MAVVLKWAGIQLFRNEQDCIFSGIDSVQLLERT